MGTSATRRRWMFFEKLYRNQRHLTYQKCDSNNALENKFPGKKKIPRFFCLHSLNDTPSVPITMTWKKKHRTKKKETKQNNHGRSAAEYIRNWHVTRFGCVNKSQRLSTRQSRTLLQRNRSAVPWQSLPHLDIVPAKEQRSRPRMSPIGR